MLNNHNLIVPLPLPVPVPVPVHIIIAVSLVPLWSWYVNVLLYYIGCDKMETSLQVKYQQKI